MDLLGDLQLLITQRQEHVTAIALIDEQLSKARKALSVIVAPDSRTVHSVQITRRPRWTGDGSLTKDRVLAALAKREPMTREELAAEVQATTLPMLLPQMVKAGELFVTQSRDKRGQRGKGLYLYARSADVFNTPERADEEAAEALEAESG